MRPPHQLIRNFSEEDIQHICKEMGIQDLDSERMRFITCLDSVDVTACPGSGKTTLAVAKLMLLARNWNSESQGICVLSHTNVAKDEISTRFSQGEYFIGTSGRPHFVGTIHSFLSRFLATPYLVSIGCPPKIIDSNISIKKRMSLIPAEDYRKINYFLKRKHKDLENVMNISTEDLNFPLDESKFGAKRGSATYDAANEALKQSIRLGYITDDDILVFAKKSLEVNPCLGKLLRSRFPFFILDEAQDTSSEQMDILDLVFKFKGGGAVVQRLGDINQSIFTSTQDSFPSSEAITISDSFRFNSTIANVANNFALSRIVPDGLKGLNASENSDLKSKHIILFEDSEISRVLPTFAGLVKRNLTEQEIFTRKISAVGSRHRNDEEEKPDHFPRFVGSYYPEYFSKAEKTQIPWFQTFHEYVLLARSSTARAHQTFDGVEVLALGVLRGLRALDPSLPAIYNSNRAYRNLKHLVDEHLLNFDVFSQSFFQLIRFNEGISQQKYECCLHHLEKAIASLAESLGAEKYALRHGFFTSQKIYLSAIDVKENQANSNEFIHEDVRIQLGSIHSIKGETHSATLLLETYSKGHFVKSILPWLTGVNENGAKANNATKKDRLKLAYVALTRPRYLVGVAAPFKSLGRNEKIAENTIYKLQEQGWVIHQLKKSTDSLLESGYLF